MPEEGKDQQAPRLTLDSPVVRSFLAGIVSGTCSTVLFQPLDLVKTRLQLPAIASAVQLAAPPATAAAATGRVGLAHVVSQVIRHERLAGLWKGLVPSLFRTVPGVGVYFSSLEVLRARVGGSGGAAGLSPLQAVAVGVCARSVSGLVILPLTVVKTRFESGQFQYRSVAGALVTIYRGEGARGLFSGLAATLLRDAPFSGLYLMFYTQTRRLVRMRTESQAPVLVFASGIVAGVLASMVTQPADVVKTHMQIHPDSVRSVSQVVISVWSAEGAAGFMRGIVPRTLRRSLMAALAWTMYEQVMKSFRLK